MKSSGSIPVSKEELHKLTAGIPGVLYCLTVSSDGKGKFTYVSDGSRKMFGLAPIEILNSFDTFWAKIHPEDKEWVSEFFTTHFDDKEFKNNEFRITDDNGDIKWILAASQPEQDEGYDSIIRSGVFIDVTKRKMKEIDLKHKAILLEQAQQLSNMGVWRWNVKENTVEWSDELYRIYGLNSKDFKSSFEGYLDLVHPDDKQRTKETVLNALQQKKEFSFEERILRPNKEVRHLNTWGNVITDQNGEPVEMFGACLDVTETRNAEQELRKSLSEKEVLLQEVHHRVKNNLAVISGLIELQTSTIDNYEAKQLLIDSQMRVQSIAKIHENLYQNDSLVDIQFHKFIREMASAIERTISPNGKEIVIHFNLNEEIELNVNQAIPCGMVLSEMLTNAYKHAFNGREKGTIDVQLKELNGDLIFLSVEDDGVGLPSDLNIEQAESMGCLLINTLNKQLNGDLNITNGEGATFSITFKRRSLKGSASKLEDSSTKD